MSSLILRDQKIWFDGYDLTGHSNSLSLEYGAEALDETVFGLDTRKFKGGLKTVAAGIQGLFDETPDTALATNIGASGKVLSIGISGTEGDPAYSFQAMAGQYSPNGSMGDLLGFSLSAAAQGKLVRGTLMENNSGITSSSTGTARQLGAVSSSQKLYAALHVLSVSGTSPTLDVIVESDNAEGFSSGTTRISFTQSGAIGSEWKEVSGAFTDDWWRIGWTVGGSATPTFSFVVILAIH